MDDRSVTQRPRVAVPLAACSGPAALAGMEALEAINDALQRPHLRRRERPRLKRRQSERPDAARGVPPGNASGARATTQPQNPDSDARWLLTVDGPSPDEASESRQPTTSRRTTLARRSWP